MDDLEQRIERAKQDTEAMNTLIRDYLPFIKSQAARIRAPQLDQEDAQSIAMLVFCGCVRQYRPGRGGLLAFAGTCIQNRLIDEGRKAKSAAPLISIRSGEEAEAAEAAVSLARYDKEREREQLCGEIDELSAVLDSYGISFSELSRICPKHKKARSQCQAIAEYIIGDDRLSEKLLCRRQLAQGELAAAFGLSVKTIEKHRKYIVALALLLSGDYPGIRAFLPHGREVRG